eukprot:555207-Pyramimonas_sp.AAC.1
MYYLDVCFVKVVMLRPNCRKTGLPPYCNAKVNSDTWHEHHKGDLPHIKLCGKVAVRQHDIRRFFLREQPVRTWVDQMPPWTTLAKSKGICKVNMGPCTTGSRDSHRVLLRKPTEIMANHRLLLTPFERKRCTGHRQR